MSRMKTHEIETITDGINIQDIAIDEINVSYTTPHPINNMIVINNTYNASTRTINFVVPIAINATIYVSSPLNLSTISTEAGARLTVNSSSNISVHINDLMMSKGSHADIGSATLNRLAIQEGATLKFKSDDHHYELKSISVGTLNIGEFTQYATTEAFKALQSIQLTEIFAEPNTETQAPEIKTSEHDTDLISLNGITTDDFETA